jgi:hypothetical protein
MTPTHLHVIGVDPGQTTGWARLTVPRACVFGTADPEVLRWDTGEITGPEPEQVRDLARLCRTTQSLDYNIGPALIVEDFDLMASNPTTDAEVLLSPVRIAAMIRMTMFMGALFGAARLTMQGRTIAKTTMTDERLRKSGYWVEGSDHERDAVRHAFTALRRAREKPAFRDRLWA